MAASLVRSRRSLAAIQGGFFTREDDTMTRFAGLILAGGIVLAAASTADAQVAISLGNPYAGRGLYVGTGYGAYPYGYAAPATVYSSGYRGYVASTPYATTFVSP